MLPLALAAALLSFAPDPTELFTLRASYTLKNGLRVALEPDLRQPWVTVLVAYEVGFLHDPPGRPGLAHLYEHLSFDGTDFDPYDVDAYHGSAVALEANGSTSLGRTEYYATLPRENLALGLWLESRRMQRDEQRPDAQRLEVHRRIVRNEMWERFESATDRAPLFVLNALFPGSFPTAETGLGPLAATDVLSLEDIRQLRLRHYRPDNASLVVLGNFTTGEARRLIDDYFAGIPRGKDPRPPVSPRRGPTAEAQVTHDVDHGQPAKLTLAWTTPPFLHQQDTVADVAAELLASGRGSRLGRRLLGPGGGATEVEAVQSSDRPSSVFLVRMAARPGAARADLGAQVDAALDELGRGPIGQDELSRARARLRTWAHRARQWRVPRARRIADHMRVYGNLDRLDGEAAQIEAVDGPAVSRFVREFLLPNRRVNVWEQPRPAAAAARAPR
jgi:zinc protease